MNVGRREFGEYWHVQVDLKESRGDTVLNIHWGCIPRTWEALIHLSIDTEA
jgi:hypothetical protein